MDLIKQVIKVLAQLCIFAENTYVLGYLLYIILSAICQTKTTLHALRNLRLATGPV